MRCCSGISVGQLLEQSMQLCRTLGAIERVREEDDGESWVMRAELG